MTTRPRIVSDTNVLVSDALFQQSVPRRAFDRATLAVSAKQRAVGQIIIISKATLAELREVLDRPRDRYVSSDGRR
jgi:predicted nucleic acid-binding protein